MKSGDILCKMINEGRHLMDTTGEFTNRTVTHQILCWRFHDNCRGNGIIGVGGRMPWIEQYITEEMN